MCRSVGRSVPGQSEFSRRGGFDPHADFVDQSAVYLRQDKAQRHILVGRIQQRGGKRNLRARKAVSHIRGENQQLARELLIA